MRKGGVRGTVPARGRNKNRGKRAYLAFLYGLDSDGSLLTLNLSVKRKKKEGGNKSSAGSQQWELGANMEGARP